NSSGPQGINLANTGKTAADIFGTNVTDGGVIDYLATYVPGSGCTSGSPSCTVTGGPLDLYQYALLSNYKSTQDTDWFDSAITPPTPPLSGTLHPVETAILSSMKTY